MVFANARSFACLLPSICCGSMLYTCVVNVRLFTVFCVNSVNAGFGLDRGCVCVCVCV